MKNTENNFSFIRQTVLSKPTIPEYQIASRIAKSIQFERDAIVEDLLVRSRLEKPSNAPKDIFINYGIKHFSKHQLWKDDLSLVIETVPIGFENWYIDVQTTNNTNYRQNFNYNSINQLRYRQKSKFLCKNFSHILSSRMHSLFK